MLLSMHMVFGTYFMSFLGDVCANAGDISIKESTLCFYITSAIRNSFSVQKERY